MTESKAYELSITIEDERLVTAQSQDGTKVASSLNMDALQREQIGIYKEWLELGKITQQREYSVFGTLLYRVLFNREVELLFQTMFEKARQSGQRLRVQLGFGDRAVDLADLPWEYLYYPKSERQEGFFFATQVDLILSRYIVSGKGRPELVNKPEQGKLLVLLAVAQPLGLPSLVADLVIETVRNLSSERFPIEVRKLDKPTLPSLLESMTAYIPHVLHFMGHARFNPSERRTDIALAGPDEKTVGWIRDREFAEFFYQMRSTPPLVILHLCESADPSEPADPNASFANLAPLLLARANISAVVATRYPMPNREAVSFYRSLYRDLARGEPVDGAVQAARFWITVDNPDAYDGRAFGAPIVFDTSHEGIVDSSMSSFK
jgi:hypothetical protein